jgi:hypothetical protein
MAGAGLLPFGLGPFGFGTPLSVEAPPAGAAGSRYLNPATGDYEQDPTTRQFAQMPALRQRVVLALRTLLRSSTAVPTMGVELPRKMGTTYAAEVRNAVLVALRQLVEIEKIMRVDGITTVKGVGGRSLITVSYTDLTTGEADEARVNG